jgi:hypothetical protein
MPLGPLAAHRGGNRMTTPPQLLVIHATLAELRLLAVSHGGEIV